MVSVVRADSFDTAVKMVNDHEYGNGTAIFTRDGDAARTFADGIEIGMVGINVPIPCRSPIIPSAAGSGHCLVIIRLMAWKVCVSTRLKTVTSRWPTGIRSGAQFNFPSMTK